MNAMEKEFCDLVVQLNTRQKRLMLLICYTLDNRKADIDNFTTEEITRAIELMKDFAPEGNEEYSSGRIEWLQAIKAERENG